MMIIYPYYEILKTTTDRPDCYILAVDCKYLSRSDAIAKARQVAREDYVLDVVIMEYYPADDYDETRNILQTPIHL